MQAPFIWSWSRHRQLAFCPRAYWFSYYGASGGWRAEADDRTREIFRLKRLVGRSQWLGQIAHTAIATVLRGLMEQRPVDEGALVQGFVEDAQNQIGAARGLEMLRMGNDPVGFIDLEFGSDPGDALWQQTLDDLRTRMQDLLSHPITTRLRQVPRQILIVDRLQKVVVEGYRFWAAPDVLVRDRSGGASIIDWKTGGAHDPATVAQQLGVYALWVSDAYGIEVEKLHGIQANVPGDTFLTVTFDLGTLNSIRELLATSVQAMLAYLPDPTQDAAPEDSFERLAEGSEACKTCVFRVPCGRA